MRFSLSLLTFSIFLLFSYSTIAAQNQGQPACSSTDHSGFDFWIGEWKVVDAEGKHQGDNSIVKVEKDCVLTESWTSSTGFTGRSMNYFDPSDSTWNQLWLDGSGTILKLKGQASEGKMVLNSDLKKGRVGKMFYNQITWSQQEDGTVLQLWEIFGEDNLLLSTAFSGIYQRK